MGTRSALACSHIHYSINLPEISPNCTQIYVSNGNLPLNDGNGQIFLSAVESESHVQTASKMSSQLTGLKNSKTRLKSGIPLCNSKDSRGITTTANGSKTLGFSAASV